MRSDYFVSVINTADYTCAQAGVVGRIKTIHRRPDASTPLLKCKLPLTWVATLFCPVGTRSFQASTEPQDYHTFGVRAKMWYRQLYVVNKHYSQGAHRVYYRRCNKVVAAWAGSVAQAEYEGDIGPFVASVARPSGKDAADYWKSSLSRPKWEMHVGDTDWNESGFKSVAFNQIVGNNEWMEQITLDNISDMHVVIDVDWAKARNPFYFYEKRSIYPQYEPDEALHEDNHKDYYFQTNTSVCPYLLAERDSESTSINN